MQIQQAEQLTDTALTIYENVRQALQKKYLSTVLAQKCREEGNLAIWQAHNVIKREENFTNATDKALEKEANICLQVLNDLVESKKATIDAETQVAITEYCAKLLERLEHVEAKANEKRLQIFDEKDKAIIDAAHKIADTGKRMDKTIADMNIKNYLTDKAIAANTEYTAAIVNGLEQERARLNAAIVATEQNLKLSADEEVNNELQTELVTLQTEYDAKLEEEKAYLSNCLENTKDELVKNEILSRLQALGEEEQQYLARTPEETYTNVLPDAETAPGLLRDGSVEEVLDKVAEDTQRLTADDQAKDEAATDETAEQPAPSEETAAEEAADKATEETTNKSTDENSAEEEQVAETSVQNKGYERIFPSANEHPENNDLADDAELSDVFGEATTEVQGFAEWQPEEPMEAHAEKPEEEFSENLGTPEVPVTPEAMGENHVVPEVPANETANENPEEIEEIPVAPAAAENPVNPFRAAAAEQPAPAEQPAAEEEQPAEQPAAEEEQAAGRNPVAPPVAPVEEESAGPITDYSDGDGGDDDGDDDDEDEDEDEMENGQLGLSLYDVYSDAQLTSLKPEYFRPFNKLIDVQRFHDNFDQVFFNNTPHFESAYYNQISIEQALSELAAAIYNDITDKSQPHTQNDIAVATEQLNAVNDVRTDLATIAAKFNTLPAKDQHAIGEFLHKYKRYVNYGFGLDEIAENFNPEEEIVEEQNTPKVISVTGAEANNLIQAGVCPYAVQPVPYVMAMPLAYVPPYVQPVYPQPYYPQLPTLTPQPIGYVPPVQLVPIQPTFSPTALVNVAIYGGTTTELAVQQTLGNSVSVTVNGQPVDISQQLQAQPQGFVKSSVPAVTISIYGQGMNFQQPQPVMAASQSPARQSQGEGMGM